MNEIQDYNHLKSVEKDSVRRCPAGDGKGRETKEGKNRRVSYVGEKKRGC